MIASDEVLKLNDAGSSVEQIADALDLSEGYIYSVLRKHRPKRKRKMHRKWSPHRDAIVRLAARGKSAKEIADSLGVTTACVHKWKSKSLPPCPVALPNGRCDAI